MPVFSVESIAEAKAYIIVIALASFMKTSYVRALRTQCDRSIVYLGDGDTKWQPTDDVIRVFGLCSQLSKLSYR